MKGPVWLSAVRYAYDKYCELRNYLIVGDFHKKEIKVFFEDGKLRLRVRSRGEVIGQIMAEIQEFMDKTPSNADIIPYSLQKALEGCNFINFTSKESGGFIQFFTLKRKLEMIITLPNNKRGQKYYYTILGVLAENDFIKRKFHPPRSFIGSEMPKHYTYEVAIEDESRFIDADLGRDVELAAKIVLEVFKRAYNNELHNMSVMVN